MSEDSIEPLVDIGIPVSGRVDFVVEAIESVLAQTLQAWRLVISQDGPADDEITRRVAPYLEDDRISAVSTGSTMGAASHMTRLINAGHAPYVALLHDDDLWDPPFLARRVDFLQNHVSCGFVFSPVKVIDEYGTCIEEWRVVLRDGLHEPMSIVPRILRTNIVASPSVVVRRTAYEAVGGFDSRLRRIYDHEMWLRLALNGPVGYLSARDASWRIHGSQSTRSLEDRQEDFRQFMRSSDALVRERLPTARLSPRERRRTLSSWLLTNALDAVVHGDRPLARSDLAHALVAYPLSVLDPRVAVATLALILGPRAQRLLARTRSLIRQRGIKVHLRSNR